VLGLGDIGPLAAKPVMEGKAVLFKKFAGIDVFDIEIDEKRRRQAGRYHRLLEPTFGGINLEDIKAPECFLVEQPAARAHEDPGVPRRPARHRDRGRRGDLNALHVVGKDIGEVKLVSRAAARRASPASTCWSPRPAQGERDAGRPQGRGLHRAAPRA
jgi:malate dehydrogenase (oxaloacetate-decarboxylating)(NADP+)